LPSTAPTTKKGTTTGKTSDISDVGVDDQSSKSLLRSPSQR
jgi:hypothetical protein